MCYGWPLNCFFVIVDNPQLVKNDNPQLVSITRVNVINFILLISAAFTVTVVAFIAFVVITTKVHFQLRLFLSILFVVDQLLQDSFGKVRVR